jgi:hypothetical protein
METNTGFCHDVLQVSAYAYLILFYQNPVYDMLIQLEIAQSLLTLVELPSLEQTQGKCLRKIHHPPLHQ